MATPIRDGYSYSELALSYDESIKQTYDESKNTVWKSMDLDDTPPKFNRPKNTV
jgi:hypothetical protein